MQIILVRGLPGSGKTTRAKEFLNSNPGFVHIESDDWFVRNEIYTFDPFELNNAHQRCVSDCEFALRKNKDVILSNTFTTAAECAPYFVLEQKYRACLSLITCVGTYGSTHGVPPDKVEMMRLRFQPDGVIQLIARRDYHLFYANPYDAYYHFLNNPL